MRLFCFWGYTGWEERGCFGLSFLVYHLGTDILDIASVDARYYYALPECFGKRWSWIWELLWVESFGTEELIGRV